MTVMTWGFAVACAAMMSRGWWPEVSVDPRFQTMALLFNLALLCGVLCVVNQRPPVLAVIVMVVAFAQVLPFQKTLWNEASYLSWSVKTAHQAAAFGATDRESVSPSLPIDLLVDGENHADLYRERFLRDNRVYLPYGQWLSGAGVIQQQCPGVLAQHIQPQEARHAWLAGEAKSISGELLVLDNHGNVAGTGRVQWMIGNTPRPWKVVYDPAMLDGNAWPLRIIAQDQEGHPCLVMTVDQQALADMPIGEYLWGHSYWHGIRAKFLRGEISWD